MKQELHIRCASAGLTISEIIRQNNVNITEPHVRLLLAKADVQKGA
jgi:hypothetical protein